MPLKIMHSCCREANKHSNQNILRKNIFIQNQKSAAKARRKAKQMKLRNSPPLPFPSALIPLSFFPALTALPENP
jgi:hypothetical protein